MAKTTKVNISSDINFEKYRVYECFREMLRNKFQYLIII